MKVSPKIKRCDCGKSACLDSIESDLRIFYNGPSIIIYMDGQEFAKAVVTNERTGQAQYFVSKILSDESQEICKLKDGSPYLE